MCVHKYRSDKMSTKIYALLTRTNKIFFSQQEISEYGFDRVNEGQRMIKIKKGVNIIMGERPWTFNERYVHGCLQIKFVSRPLDAVPPPDHPHEMQGFSDSVGTSQQWCTSFQYLLVLSTKWYWKIVEVQCFILIINVTIKGICLAHKYSSSVVLNLNLRRILPLGQKSAFFLLLHILQMTGLGLQMLWWKTRGV